MQLTAVLVLLVSGALVGSVQADWASTPSSRRYLMPSVSPSWVSYWGLSAKSNGNPVIGLKIWVSPSTEATDIEENLQGRRLYFATDNVRGLTLPQDATAYMDCAFCPDKAVLSPVSSLGTTYTLPAAVASADHFVVAVVAVEDGTTVTAPGVSETLNSWKQLDLDRKGQPSETLQASKPVAVFVLKKKGWTMTVSQLS